MYQRGIPAALFLLLIASLLLGGFSFLVLKREHPPTISASSFNRGKFGTNAFYELLRRHLGEVERLGRVVFAWPEQGTVVAVRPIVSMDEKTVGTLSPLMTAALLEWLSRGNVLISFGLIDELKGPLELDTLDPAAVISAVPAVKVGKPLKVRQLRLTSLSEGETGGGAQLVLRLPELPSLDGMKISYEIIPDELGVESLAGYPEIRLMRGFLALEGIPSPPLMEVIEVGEGRVVLVNLTQPVMNRWIAQGDNAVFALSLVELFRRSDAPIYFYEVPHGNRSYGVPLVKLLTTTPGGLTILGLAFSIYLILVPQLVPLRRSYQRVKSTSTFRWRESLIRLSYLYRRLGATDFGVHGLLSGTRVYLGRKLRLGRPISLTELSELASHYVEPRRYLREYRLLSEAIKAEREGDYSYFINPQQLAQLSQALAFLTLRAGEAEWGQ